MLGGNPGTPQNPGTPGTNLLYAGEQWDASAQMYYNRARYYDPSSGRFNRLDPFPGNPQDPQSLHKYTYAHSNPVNNVDPTGKFTLTEIVCVSAIIATTISFAMNPLATAKFVAKAAVTFAEFICFLFSANTWIEAAKGVISEIADIIKNPARLIREILFAVATKVSVVFAAISMIWSAIKTLGVVRQLLSMKLARKTIAQIAAVIVATVVISIGVSLIFRKAAKAGKAVAQKYFNKVKYKGTTVYQRDDLIDPKVVDPKGRTNLERMEKGLAPIGPDGKPINLHHMLQDDTGPMAELTQAFHTRHKSAIHINPTSTPSGINRNTFQHWKEDYWMFRTMDFE